ncbi:hypothetical protein [uncultured Kordia sp.]|uniref:hypothetical protein n=1 Tax=uncultured Kordia sp. TaxID=507699 RepID=UPI0026364E9A|nr:hypothetical protein [uncultured Kordia sp.]
MKKNLLFIVFLSLTNSFYAAKNTVDHSTEKRAIVKTVAPTITQQPTDITIATNETGQLTVAATNLDTVAWEFSINNGTTWIPAIDGGSFSGSNTTTISIVLDMEVTAGYLFRALVTDSGGDSIYSDTALVTILDYTTIPDSNFETALENLGYDNISDDGQVPTYLIKELTDLNVGNSNISDLTGIEDFTALTGLSVNDNSISSLNLIHNTDLTFVNARNNGLTSLDITGCPDMGLLLLENNNLTSLDLTNNTILTRVWAQNNNFNTFNVTNNPLLRAIGITNSNLTTLDLTNSIALEQLYASGNSITEIDLSNSPSIRIIGVNNNALRTLNIKNGNNTNVTTFAAANNPNLTCVAVDDIAYSTANWTSIDAQVNFVDTSCYTQIPDTNFEAALDALGYDNISTDGQILTAAIDSITSLNVINKSISDLSGIEAFTSLQTLSISDNSITSIDLSNLTQLVNLYANNNQLMALDLSTNTLLELVHANNNSLTSLNTDNISQLTELSISDNSINALDFTQNALIETVDASNNSLSSFLPTMLVDLVTLDISGNSISQINLSYNTNLEDLNAQNNQLESIDLTNNTALTSIQLDTNSLTDATFKNGNNTNIVTFSITGNSELECVLVDDVMYSETNWTNIDAQTIFRDGDYCKYTAVPDPNFEAQLSSFDDIPDDGQVPTALIATRTALSVTNDNISDLTGIEGFTALRTLRATNNSIATLDLSSNTALRTVIVNNNSLTSINVNGLTSLEELNLENNSLLAIDLSTNTSLRSLLVNNCGNLQSITFGNNSFLNTIEAENAGLTSLNTSSLTQLQNLSLSNTSLLSLDVSSNASIRALAISNTPIEFLNIQNGNNTDVNNFDATNNANLFCVLVDDIAYSTANWTAVDAQVNFVNTSCYTQIPDTNFEAALGALGYDGISADGQVLTAAIDSITSLDVINKSISDLSGIEDFTSLQTLNISDNSITSIDLSNLTQLVHLYADNNQLTALDLSSNSLLESLHADNNSLTSLNTDNISQLTELSVSDNSLSNFVPTMLGNLQILDISGNSISQLNLSNNAYLEDLNAQNNQLESIDLIANTALSSIQLDNNSLTDATFKNGNNTNIVTFSITGNSELECLFVDDATYSTINWTNIDAQMIFRDGDYCEYTAIPDDNFETVLGNEGLDDVSGDNQVPTILLATETLLNISGENIADLTGIEDFPRLRLLRAKDNNITTLDLSANTLLVNIDLEDNSITSINLNGLTSLIDLQLENNNLSTIDVSTNTALEVLTLDNNSNLASLDITTNTSLRALMASGCTNLEIITFGNSTFLATIEANNSGLTSINVSSLTRLRNIFLNNTSLTSLDVSSNASIRELAISNTPLEFFNMQNGNNTDINTFDATNNANLFCILVDDIAYSTTNWTNIDAQISFSTTYCRYTAIPDANFEAALETLGYDDISDDGQVPTALIEGVTNLSINNQNIADLTGIEDFTALQTLNASNNSLTTLDVTQNTLLELLNVRDNQLTTIDLSNNTALEDLEIDANNLESLDVSTNTLLTQIAADNNSITSLDLTTNTSLLNLSITDNGLETLTVGMNSTLRDFEVQNNALVSLNLDGATALDFINLSNNTLETLSIRNGTNTSISIFNTTGNAALTCISVDDAAYSTTNWTTIDAASSFSETDYCRYTTIPNSSFEAYLGNLGYDDIPEDGQVPTALIEVVTSLDASSQGITGITGIEDFTALEELNIEGNSVPTLDFTSNLNLIKLNCKASNATSIDITDLTALEELQAGFNPYTTLDVSTNVNLKKLQCQDSRITMLDVSNLPLLTDLNCSFSSLTTLDVRNGNNTNFTNFNAANIPNVICIQVDDVAYSTENWTNIEATASFTSTDYCRYTTIPDSNFEAVLDSLNYDDIPDDGRVPTSLIEGVANLSINNQNIADLTGIEDFTVLQTLNASNNSLTTLDVTQNTLLELLNVRDNQLTTVDLSNNTALEDLEIDANNLESLDVSTNTLLTQIAADNNSITSLDLTTNTVLENLSITDNGLETLTVGMNDVLRDFEVQNNALVSLNLDGATALDFINLSNNTLETLSIRNGTNTSISIFNTTGNAALTCISVDDAAYSTTNWTTIDAASSFSETDYCRYTTIPNSSFEAYLGSLGYDDIPEDGQVPTALIEVVTSLDASSQGITGITGIQDFTALQTLDVSSNLLSIIDVSGMPNLETFVASPISSSLESVDASNTPALKSLTLTESFVSQLNINGAVNLEELNIYTTSISSLDLSTNTSLEVIITSQSSLNVLDVSNLSALRELDVSRSNIRSLDLSNNTALEILDASNTSLNSLDIRNGNNTAITSFDVSFNGSLTCIQVDDVTYSNENWTKIDATANFTSTDYCRYTSIVDPNFEASLGNLGYDDISSDGQVPTALIEEVTSLDISSLNISDITGIQDFTALQTLDVSSTNIINLDLSGMSNLETLNMASTASLTTLDVSDATALQTITASDSNVSTIDLTNATALEEAFLFRTQITTLDISTNTALKHLEAYDNALLTGILDLTANGNLETINVNNTGLSTLDLRNGNNSGITTFSATPNASLLCILVDDVAYSTTNWTSIDVTTSFSTTYCSYTQVPDPNFEAALETLGYDDISDDGQVPTVLIEGISSLNVSSQSISDFTGIEDFTALTYLNIAFNLATTVDLSDNILLEEFRSFRGALESVNISNCTNLRILNIDENALTTLDLSNNSALEELVINRNNITSLDVTNNINLTKLEAAGNSIGTINLSTNTLVEVLFLSDCGLTTIDLSNNVNLRNIILSNNDISTINLSNNTALENFTMERNQLIAIDFSNNILIEDIDIRNNDITTLHLPDLDFLEDINIEENFNLSSLTFGNLPVFHELFANECALTSIDVSNLPTLERLDLRQNQLTELDLSQNIALTRVYISDNNLSFLTLQNGNNTSITDSRFNATNNPNLTCILVDDATYSTTNWTSIDATTNFSDTYCRYTLIPDPNFEAALEALGYDDISDDGQVPTALIEVVTSLSISNQSITNLAGIEDFTALTFLNVNSNNLSTIDVTANVNLEELLISTNSISTIDLSTLINLTRIQARLNNFTSLDLSDNVLLEDINLEGNASLTTITFPNNALIDSMDISGCNLTAIDLSTLPNLLELDAADNQLTSIDFSNNLLVQYIYISNNTLSTALDLSLHTQLEDLEAINCNLTGLNIKNGNNTNIGYFNVTSNPNLSCISVDDIAYSTTNLTNIDATASFTATDYCRYTAIPDPNFEARLALLGYDDISTDGQVPTALIEVVNSLNASNANISDLTGIKDFTALQALNVSGNTIADLDISEMPNLLSLEAVAAITSSLDISNTPLLETVNVYENSMTIISLTGATALEELYIYRTHISTLDLSGSNLLTRLIAFEMPNLTYINLADAVLLRDLELQRTHMSRLDLTSNISLESLNISETELRIVNLQNGNNTSITSFDARNNIDLDCIIVDDAVYSTANWSNIDAQASFNEMHCRYTQIPDANFEAYLDNLGYDDISDDGQVPTVFIENINGLTISNIPIADLTGIEDFTNLDNLSLVGTNLTALNFSTNTRLERLLLTNNTGIASLDVSGNIALDFLSINGSSLTSLDLTNNPILNYLSLNNVDITALDLSMNTELEKFFLSNAPISSLNLQNENNTNINQFSIGNTPNLTCVLVDDAEYSDINWFAVDSTITFNEMSCASNFTVAIKIFLQGAALNPNTGEESLMRDDLRVAGYIPTRSPYADMLSCENTVFNATGNDAIVDWVWVELREGTDNTIVSYSRSALLQRDGDIVDVDGVSPLNFATDENTYYVVANHRSHLGIMSSAPITFVATNSIDFTTGSTYGSNAQTTSGMPSGVAALWAGNANSDMVVQYSGTSPDTPNILSTVLNDPGNFLNFPTYNVIGYYANDINMDGMIQYSGTNPDTPFILQNVLAHPGNFLNFSTYQIIEQLPQNQQ